MPRGNPIQRAWNEYRAGTAGFVGFRTHVSEAKIEETCTGLLELDGWRALKTDPCSDRSRGKGFGEKGMADCLYLRYHDVSKWVSPGLRSKDPQGEVIWIEWKSRTGRAAAHQLGWHRAERARGGVTLIAGIDFPRSIEGFFEWYRASGLMRRDLQLNGR